MLVQDENGNWFDDGTGDDGSGGYGFDMSTLFNSPYMSGLQMPGQNYGTAKHNLNEPLAVGQSAYNQILTGLKNQNQLGTSPSVLYNAMVEMGIPTMDQSALTGFDQYGNPVMGGGGGSGGADGNGYNPNFVPSTLKRLQAAPEGSPGATIWQGIQTNQDPLTVKLSFRENGAYDTETLNAIDKQIDDAYGESALMERNDLAGQNQPVQQTAMQEWMAKNGLINPMDTYGPDNLPGDIDTRQADWSMAANQNRYLKQADEYQKLADTTRPKALPGNVGGFPGIDIEGIFEQTRANKTNDAAKELTDRIFRSGLGMNAVNPETGVSRPAPNDWDVVPGGSGTSIREGAVRQNRTRQGRQLPTEVPANRDIYKKRAADRAHAKWQSGVYERSAQSARQKAQENSGAGYRQLVSNLIAESGRTPARDAQRAIQMYLQRQGNIG